MFGCNAWRFDADGLWEWCPLFFFADPLDFTISAELAGFGGKWYNSS